MSNSKPYWYNLLIHFEENRYFTNGLTLPFILGSRTIIEPTLPLQSIEEFFKHAEESKTYINVLKCGGIGEYVFRIGDKEDVKVYDEKGIFIIPDLIFENCPGSSEIISELCKKYAYHLEKNFFSKNVEEWGNYTQNELEKLMEVKNQG